MRFAIGERLKQVLDLEASTLIEYKHHEVAMQDMSTFRHVPILDTIFTILCAVIGSPLELTSGQLVFIIVRALLYL